MVSILVLLAVDKTKKPELIKLVPVTENNVYLS